MELLGGKSISLALASHSCSQPYKFQPKGGRPISASLVRMQRVLQTSGSQIGRRDLQVASSTGSDERHAVLHDFCMIIPYSGLVVLAGLVSIPFGAGWRGMLLASAGVLEMAVSIKSLKQFQAERESTPYTITSAGITLGLAAHFFRILRRQTAFWPKALLVVMAALSSAAFAFLVYNVLAGGNPPKADKAITAEESMTPQKAY